jgi:hypothetical protein
METDQLQWRQAMKTFFRITICLLSLGVLTTIAKAATPWPTDSGDDLYAGLQACARVDAHSGKQYANLEKDVNYCLVTEGYVKGAFNVIFSLRSMDFTVEKTDLTHGQIYEVVFKFLDSHPELRHYSSSSLIEAALEEAWGTDEVKNSAEVN